MRNINDEEVLSLTGTAKDYDSLERVIPAFDI
jgi:hypothetical protein